LDDFIIRETDAIIVAAHSEEDLSLLDVFIYEEAEDNLYVHHEIMLPSFPLSLAWMDCNGTKEEKGNFIAVGSFETDIEIWDLDVVDSLEPLLTLGISKKNRQKENQPKVHTLLLSWVYPGISMLEIFLLVVPQIVQSKYGILQVGHAFKLCYTMKTKFKL